MKNLETDQLRRTILQLIRNGYVHYTDIEKKTVATCLRFATSNTFKAQFYDYLLVNGFIKRVARGIYAITKKEKNS